MAKTIFQLKKDIREIIKEFGFENEKEFISQAIREKILELKKLQFFLISEKIKKGLKEKGVKPEHLLRKFKS